MAADEACQLRRNTRAAAFGGSAPGVQGLALGPARGPLSADKKKVGQPPHVAHAVAPHPETSQCQIGQVRPAATVDTLVEAPFLVNSRGRRERLWDV